MDSFKFSLLLIVFYWFVFSMTSAAETCSFENDDPLKGVLMDEAKYPKAKIDAAVASSGMDKQIEADAQKWDILSRSSDQLSLPPTGSDPLCYSNFVQRYATGWYFVDVPKLGYCWVHHHYWRFPLTNVECRRGRCNNMPCWAWNYFCVATNYKIYWAWTWCTNGGLQYRRFTLPQCCECRRFNC